MKIKKLTIHGFKSFVDKVTLNFPMGTSGIIGPNGCGKSNIVDAIRWVLGEQNARHLRGKHMEDIIFNGSDTRKPLGMAEVVLTFSNDTGKAGAHFGSFSEIEISRRLYRSGESEYYINKVQSRLRDIIDLFTDTGIGTRAYSIIEQGQVGWLINAKPEDRRTIFEEAAGINKFKHKKEAALKRLEATKENLTRVNDIISEVKRQLNSLNRQAKKAERYKALREELKSIDLLLSSLELRKLKDALDTASKRLVSIKDEELALTAQMGLKEGLSDEIKVEYDNIEAEYKGIRERIFELEKLIQNEERGSALAKMRVDELKRGEERITAEIDELKGSVARVTVELESLRSELSQAGSIIDAETLKLNENSASYDALLSRLKGREEAQRVEKAESLKLSARLSDVRHSLQNSIRDEENYRVREAKAASQKEELTKALLSLEDPLNGLKQGLNASIERKTAKEAELKTVRGRLESLESERVKKTSEIKSVKDEYARAAARLSTLEEMERNFENLKGGAKAIMKKHERGGIHGLIADVIETNPGYEKAVEAVMGERLQYVIVESHKEGVAAIEYLKANSSGRGSFVPVKDVRGASPMPVQAGDFNYPGAKELISEVKIKEGYPSIVNYLLGDTLVVDTLGAALELWSQSGLFRTIVTLEGDLIDAQGIITGGSSSSSDGILQKRGEIRSIKKLSAGLEEKIASLEAGLKGIEEGIAGAKASLDECRESLHAIDIERVNIEGNLKRSAEESTRLARTRDAAESEVKDAAVKISEMISRKASLSAERDSLENQLQAREGTIAALANEISSLSGEKDALLGIVTEIRVKLAQAKERFESLKRQIAEKDRSILDADRRLEVRKAEIEKGRSETEEKSRLVEESKRKLDGFISAIDGVKKEEVAKTEQLNALATRIKEVEHELKEIKANYSELQELKGELSIEVKELELSAISLRERINEKYVINLAPFTHAEGETMPDVEFNEAKRNELREKIADLGEVSLSALEEYADLERRHQFLLDQQTDLTKSVETLHTAITRINRTTREKFKTAFEEISHKFQETFPKFFNGGRAELRLTEEGDVLEAGVEIVAQPPGKRLQNITLLSGGEKALTATALIFAIFLIKPSPFCLLDEVDAPLDDANIDRFNTFVKEMSKISQFMLITHNKKTMEMADALYGITMEEPGVSKMISVKF